MLHGCLQEEICLLGTNPWPTLRANWLQFDTGDLDNTRKGSRLQIPNFKNVDPQAPCLRDVPGFVSVAIDHLCQGVYSLATRPVETVPPFFNHDLGEHGWVCKRRQRR